MKNVTVFVRSEGNTAITLSMNTTNWNPPNASDFITLSWDYGGQVIDPNEVVGATGLVVNIVMATIATAIASPDIATMST